MHNSKLNQQLTRLQQLVDRTQVATEDIELQGHWGRYLCVMVAGLLEDGLQTIYSEFASNSSSPHVARYVGDTLSQVVATPLIVGGVSSEHSDIHPPWIWAAP